MQASDRTTNFEESDYVNILIIFKARSDSGLLKSQIETKPDINMSDAFTMLIDGNKSYFDVCFIHLITIITLPGPPPQNVKVPRPIKAIW